MGTETLSPGNTLKACMVAYTFYEGDNRVRRYAEMLVREGHQVDVIAMSAENKRCHKTLNGVNLYSIQRRTVNEKTKIEYFFKVFFFLINSFVVLSIHHMRKRYDIVHVHSIPDFEVFAALIPKLFGAKIILDIHDLVPEFYTSKFNTSDRSLVFKLLVLIEKLSCAFADHVIIANDIWKERLIGRSVKENKCSTILNFPDPFIFYHRAVKKDNDKFLIIYPGTLSWHQGVDVAIKALHIIQNKVPEAEFHIYGNGPEKNALIALSTELGMNKKVFFHDVLILEEIVGKMVKSDLGIVPKRKDSFGNEAFSTKIFEFMALRVPVICSDTAIDKYYFNDSLVKFFSSGDENELAESILLLARNKDIRERLVANASEYIQSNTWDVKKHEYLAIISNLMRT